MPVNKIQQTTDALPNAESGEWAWFKIVSNILKFNSDGSNTRSVVSTDQTQTLTNKTLTAPTITAPVISGSATIATGATLTSPTITAPTITGAGSIAAGTSIVGSINSDIKVLAASLTYTSTTALATITGFSWTVVPGTYVFEVYLPVTMTTVGGFKVGFGLTTAVLTSVEYHAYQSTATDNTGAISARGTTAASGTTFFDQKTVAYTYAKVVGSMVVGTGGTFALQAAQNTSASGGDVTIVLLGAYARVVRVA